MKQLKLEVGKTYLSRAGKEVKIVEKGGEGKYQFRGSDGECYTESGRFDYHVQESLYDLIEEVEELPETRHTFAIPDGVKKVTVEQLGNRIVVEMVPEDVEPKPGDVMINEKGSVYIFKTDLIRNLHSNFVWLGENGRLSVIRRLCSPGRPATPEEAQPLWDALKKAGKRWNPETMQVEEIPEKEKIEQWMRGAGWSVNEFRLRMIEDYIKHKEGEK